MFLNMIVVISVRIKHKNQDKTYHQYYNIMVNARHCVLPKCYKTIKATLM